MPLEVCVIAIVANGDFLPADDSMSLVENTLCAATVFPPNIIKPVTGIIVAATLPCSLGREEI